MGGSVIALPHPVECRPCLAGISLGRSGLSRAQGMGGDRRGHHAKVENQVERLSQPCARDAIAGGDEHRRGTVTAEPPRRPTITTEPVRGTNVAFTSTIPPCYCADPPGPAGPISPARAAGRGLGPELILTQVAMPAGFALLADRATNAKHPITLRSLDPAGQRHGAPQLPCGRGGACLRGSRRPFLP